MVQTTETAIFATESSGSKMYYIHKDHLGSYQTITDENGEVATLDGLEQVYSFDPWGRRRNATTWSYEDVPTAFLFDRGFTGHEHLDAFNLINMNGRVYDPQLGMFLSPDPYVQMPGSTQNYNRYAYCLNNPLIYTDPSGEFIFTLATLIAAPFTGGTSLALLPTAIGADMGMWAGGSAVNGTANPFKWDYSNGKTWAGMGVGALAGGIGGGISSGAIGGLSGLDAAVMGGMASGAINGGGMTAIAGGGFSDVIGGMVQGATIGGFSAAAGYGAFQGANKLLPTLNPFRTGIVGSQLFGDFPLQNTITYMASSTASQMTSNIMTGQGIFDNLDYGINPGIVLPLYADIGSHFASIRTRLLKEQYKSKDGRIVKKAWPWGRSTEIYDNGDLVVHTGFTAEKWIPEQHFDGIFGLFKKTVPAHMETYYLNSYSPVMISNYRDIVQSMVISW